MDATIDTDATIDSVSEIVNNISNDSVSRSYVCNTNETGYIRYIEELKEYQKCNGKKRESYIKIISQNKNSSDANTSITESKPLKENTFNIEGIDTCESGDKRFFAVDSSYEKCDDGRWQKLDEIWIELPESNEVITQNKFIPNARFDTAFVLRPAKAQNGGKVRCTFDGSEPDSTTKIFPKEKLIDTTTVVRCTEFLNNIPQQKQTETYFIDESILMPVLSISVDPEYVNDYLNATPCEPNPCYEAKFWEDVEYPAHVEYFGQGSSSEQKRL